MSQPFSTSSAAFFSQSAFFTLSAIIIWSSAIPVSSCILRIPCTRATVSGASPSEDNRYPTLMLPLSAVFVCCLFPVFSGNKDLLLPHPQRENAIINAIITAICFLMFSIPPFLCLTVLPEVSQSQTFWWLLLFLLTKTCDNKHNNCYQIWKHLEDFLHTSSKSWYIKI